MEQTEASVRALLDGVTGARRRRDAEALLELFGRVTGQPARMWGPSIVGFGEYHYRYASGREGDAPAAAFSPRRAASTLYLTGGVEAFGDELARLGPHTTGNHCLYIADLSAVDSAVLEEIVTRSYRAAPGTG